MARDERAIQEISQVMASLSRMDALLELGLTYPELRWDMLRQIHKIIQIERHPYDPYPVDWTQLFTPIERQCWGEIRSFNLPFYPQFPIGRIFVDFADPVKKIAIECDGAAYHQDKEKDQARDLKLGLLGWKVFRVSGADCNRIIDDRRATDESLRNWYLNTIDGLVASLAEVHYGHQTLRLIPSIAYEVLALRSAC